MPQCTAFCVFTVRAWNGVRLAGSWSWEPCFILDYFEDKNEFLVEWHPGVGDRGGKGRTKVVSRLNLLFPGETPEMMQSRRQVAAANRVEEEQRLRYRERLKAMPAVLQATDRQIRIISKLIGHRVRRPERLVEQLTQEVQDGYAYVINAMDFDATLPFSQDADELPKVVVGEKIVPVRGTIQMPWHDFQEKLDIITTSHPAANPLLLDATQAVLREMEELKATGMSATRTSKSLAGSRA